MNETSDAWTDRFGAVASSLCALHCAVCALLPALFAALGVGFLLSHEAEWMLNIVAILFGAGALKLAGRTHGSRRVMGLLLVGIVGLVVSRSLEMVSDHGDHHGDEHAAHADEADHHEEGDHAHEEKADDHATDHDDHGHAAAEDGHDGHDDDDALHMAGASVGVLSGMMLFFGHLLNIRAARRCREDCCD